MSFTDGICRRGANLNENVIGSLKWFKIVSDRYRNKRKRFSLRFNLIKGHTIPQAQLLTYLRLTGQKLGLLINFAQTCVKE